MKRSIESEYGFERKTKKFRTQESTIPIAILAIIIQLGATVSIVTEYLDVRFIVRTRRVSKYWKAAVEYWLSITDYAFDLNSYYIGDFGLQVFGRVKYISIVDHNGQGHQINDQMPCITDVGLSYLKNVTTVKLNNCNAITNDGIRRLTGVRKLKIRCCSGITIEGLKHLNLEKLETQECGIAVSDLEELSNIKSIDVIGFTLTRRNEINLPNVHFIKYQTWDENDPFILGECEICFSPSSERGYLECQICLRCMGNACSCAALVWPQTDQGICRRCITKYYAIKCDGCGKTVNTDLKENADLFTEATYYKVLCSKCKTEQKWIRKFLYHIGGIFCLS